MEFLIHISFSINLPGHSYFQHYGLKELMDHSCHVMHWTRHGLFESAVWSESLHNDMFPISNFLGISSDALLGKVLPTRAVHLPKSNMNPSNAKTTFTQSKRHKDFWKTVKPCYVGIHWITRWVLSEEYPCARVSVLFPFFLHHLASGKLTTTSIRVNPFMHTLRRPPCFRISTGKKPALPCLGWANFNNFLSEGLVAIYILKVLFVKWQEIINLYAAGG